MIVQSTGAIQIRQAVASIKLKQKNSNVEVTVKYNALKFDFVFNIYEFI
jgi:hypothetical protein